MGIDYIVVLIGTRRSLPIEHAHMYHAVQSGCDQWVRVPQSKA